MPSLVCSTRTRFRHFFLVVRMRFHSLLLLALCCLMPVSAWSRLRVLPGQENIRGMAEESKFVFRGQVVGLELSKNEPGDRKGVAIIAADRWYKSTGRLSNSSRVRVQFAYTSWLQGHDCEDLVLESYWVVFGRQGDNGEIELVHDCYGALPVASLLSPQFSGDLLSRLELDFRAGLEDSNPNSRLASIQRLAGLGLPASRDALHDVIKNGSEIESRWALFAALQTGDISVMPRTVPILLNLRHNEPAPYDQPQGLIALALEKLRSPEAVPELIEILNKAPDDLVRSCVSHALMEIKDPRALEALAVHLSDTSQYVRYNSLIGMGYITHAPECTITKPEEAEKAESLCKSWWESKK